MRSLRLPTSRKSFQPPGHPQTVGVIARHYFHGQFSRTPKFRMPPCWWAGTVKSSSMIGLPLGSQESCRWSEVRREIRKGVFERPPDSHTPQMVAFIPVQGWDSQLSALQVLLDNWSKITARSSQQMTKPRRHAILDRLAFEVLPRLLKQHECFQP